MNERIFISYKRVDKERVFKLKDLIEYETKEECWIDLDGIESHDQFVNVIIRSINAADLVLFMYSHAHTKIIDFENDWTIRELNFAQEKKKRIFFINLDNAPLNDWFTLMFPRKQQVDVSSETAVKKLIQDIKNWLNESSSKSKDNHPTLKDPVIDKSESNDDDFETAEVLFEAKEYNEAIMYYLESAKRGNRTAQDKLCQFFYDSRQLVDDISDDIWQKVEELSERGESYAHFILHCKYYFDPLNKELAFNYVKRASQNKEIPLAFLRLGTHYGWGVGTKQNHILAMHNYLKAFNLGCKEACGFIGSEYEWGTSKTQKNLEKAIEFYQKGADLHDRRSMTRLARIYFYDLKNTERAKEVAQQMILCGHNYGYVLMGDFNLTNANSEYNFDNIEEAKRWFNKALLHDEYEAYASLAAIYWDIEDNHKEAYSLAYQGYNKHDSSSISTLACFFRIDRELEKAWKYYKECFDIYGSNVNNLGSIFFDDNYRKENMEDEKQLESDMEEILKTGAHNGELESLKYLIRLHSLQETGEDTYNYDVFKKTPKIQEDLKLGSELKFPEMMFFYGRLLLEDTYREFNPAKGVNYIFMSAEEGYNDALPFLLDYQKNGTYKDDVDYDKIAIRAIKQKFTEDDYIGELLRFGENKEEISEEFKEFILTILDEKKEKMKQFVLALNMLLNKYKNDKVTLDEESINKYKLIIEKEIDNGNFGYISALKSNMQILYPDYSEEKIFQHYTASNEIERKLFYAANYANDNETDIELQDVFLEKLHSIISFDESLMQDESNYDNDVKELVQAMVNYQTSYQAICKKEEISPNEYHLPKAEFLFPYMPSGVCAKISYDTFNLFMSLHDALSDIYSPMLPILGNDEKMLDYIETLKDQDLQLFLIELIEIKIDIETIMRNNYVLYKNFKDNNKVPIVEYLNKIIEKYGDKVTSKEKTYTLDNLPEIVELAPNRSLDLDNIYESEKSNVSVNTTDKQKEDEEFERLLNEFINSSSEDNSDQN